MPLMLLVVGEEGPSLQIQKNDSLEILLQKYKDVFEDKLGTLKDFEATIHVDEIAIPHFHKRHLVP